MLLEGDWEEPLRLVQPLVGLWVQRVEDVFQAVSGGCHVVRNMGKAEATGSPHVGVVVIERVWGLLLFKVLPLALELYLSGF